MARKKEFRGQSATNKMSIPDFILLAVLSLRDSKKECSFEELLKECFSLSSQTFGFPQNRQWPDSRKIDRPLRNLRKKGFIKGSPNTVFSLTLKGKKVAEQTAKALRQKKLFKD